MNTETQLSKQAGANELMNSAVRYSPCIVSEHVPDLSSLEAMLQHQRFAGKTGQDLAIALWEFMVDRDLGLFHYIAAKNPFWKKDEYDAIKTWNVYGWSICHCHASILGAMGRVAGFKTRIANIKGHEGTEFWYDDAWHYFDGDIQMYYRKHAPHQDQIASLEEIHAETTLITEQQHPSNPSHFPDRLPEDIVNLYDVEPTYLPIQDESLHSMDFILRPGEKMQRYFGHKGRRFIFDGSVKSYAKFAMVRDGLGPAEAGAEGPTERFWPSRQWGNGFYWYAPNLTNASLDLQAGAQVIEGLIKNESGIQPIEDHGIIIFDFTSPYVYCGVPDPMQRLPSQLGAQMNLAYHCACAGDLQVDISNAAGDWITVFPAADHVDEAGSADSVDSADSEDSNERNIDLDYTEYVEGRLSFQIRVQLNGAGTILHRMNNTLWFMVSPHSLPALRSIGDNKMSLHSGDKFNQASKSFLFERNYYDQDAHIDDVMSRNNCRWVPDDYARMKPIDVSNPWQLVYALQAPEDQDLTWISVYTEFEGTVPGEVTDAPACIEIAANPLGPWSSIGEMDVVEHPQGWHFSLFAEGQFPSSTQVGYLRFSCKKGFKGFRVNAHYNVSEINSCELPLEITHAWYEDDANVGRRLKTYKRVLSNAQDAYVVSCDAEPHNAYVSIEAASLNENQQAENGID
ncbi:MAG: hypothetical protein HRU15_02375 [Planctomycetes bacterium]|nr:hypothetical protein [Planctomycetota bacterium]